MVDLVCFGEIMLRLSPEYGYRLFQNDTMKTCFGGSEANVAVFCAQTGIKSKYVTKLPDNPLGGAVKSELSGFGVDTSDILTGGERLGVYYYEKGASHRPSVCVYDRKYSSFSQSKREEYDWEKILRGAKVFHFSGITPVLSAELADACLDGCKTAKKLGLTVFCDLNHREKLCGKEEMKSIMENLLPYVDVFISSVYQANDIFTIGAADNDTEKMCVTVASALTEGYGSKAVALTVRKTYSADKNGFYGMVYDNEMAYFSKEYDINVVDRVGSGDAFDGALIRSFLLGHDMKTAVEYAAAAAALKHSVNGDFSRITAKELDAFVGGGDGRVQR